MAHIITYTVRKDQSGDYVVRFRLDSVRKPDWDYFTPDCKDAHDTAKEVIREHAKYVAETGKTE